MVNLVNWWQMMDSSHFTQEQGRAARWLQHGGASLKLLRGFCPTKGKNLHIKNCWACQLCSSITKGRADRGQATKQNAAHRSPISSPGSSNQGVPLQNQSNQNKHSSSFNPIMKINFPFPNRIYLNFQSYLISTSDNYLLKQFLFTLPCVFSPPWIPNWIEYTHWQQCQGVLKISTEEASSLALTKTSHPIWLGRAGRGSVTERALFKKRNSTTTTTPPPRPPPSSSSTDAAHAHMHYRTHWSSLTPPLSIIPHSAYFWLHFRLLLRHEHVSTADQTETLSR